MQPFLKESFPYTHCFCEENVYLLVEKLSKDWKNVNVIFISNDTKSVPFSYHRETTVVWVKLVILFYWFCG